MAILNISCLLPVLVFDCVDLNFKLPACVLNLLQQLRFFVPGLLAHLLDLLLQGQDLLPQLILHELLVIARVHLQFPNHLLVFLPEVLHLPLVLARHILLHAFEIAPCLDFERLKLFLQTAELSP